MSIQGGRPPKLTFLLAGPIATLVIFGGLALLQFEGRIRIYAVAGIAGFAAVEYLVVEYLYDQRG